MKVIAILAHLMDSGGVLGRESLARIKVATDLDKVEKFNFFLTTGWDYRDDSNLRIGNVIAEKLVNEFAIEVERVITDTNSRDTVGDAFFLRKNIIRSLGIQSIVVVTSDYHVRRTDVIFKNFFSPTIKVKIIGADSGVSNDFDLQKHEESSLAAFLKTFKGVDFQSDREVYMALQAKHPFYNGEVYEKIKLDCS